MKNFFFNSKFVKKILPKGYCAIMLFGFIFFKKSEDYYDNNTLVCHEGIHISQYKYITVYSLLINLILCCISFSWLNLIFGVLLSLIAFYIWYVLEFIVKYIVLFVKNLFWLAKKDKYKILYFKEIHQVAYYNISFEREAYSFQHQMEYKIALNKEFLPKFYKYLLCVK